MSTERYYLPTKVGIPLAVVGAILFTVATCFICIYHAKYSERSQKTIEPDVIATFVQEPRAVTTVQTIQEYSASDFSSVQMVNVDRV